MQILNKDDNLIKYDNVSRNLPSVHVGILYEPRCRLRALIGGTMSVIGLRQTKFECVLGWDFPAASGRIPFTRGLYRPIVPRSTRR